MRTIEWRDFPLPLIQVNPPNLSSTDDLIEQAYISGIFSNSGEIHREASKVLAKQVSEDLEGYLCSSNTSGLVSCLITSEVRGKHVVVSNFTFAATLHAVIMAGGIPVVCDVDDTTLVMCQVSLAKILANEELQIAAVVPTRVLGFVTDLSELIEMCHSLEVPVIVDAASCLPSTKESWNFRKTAEYEVFSLHATKVFGVGEAGFIAANSTNIERIRQTSNFGLQVDGSLKFQDGLNAKADEFTAARVLARYPSYEKDVEIRLEFTKLYDEIFSQTQGVQLLTSNSLTIFSYYPVIFKTEDALVFFQKSISKYLTTRRYYFPTLKDGYIGSANVIFDGKLEVSNSISRRILCLPVYVNCTNETRSKIQEVVKKSLEGVA